MYLTSSFARGRSHANDIANQLLKALLHSDVVGLYFFNHETDKFKITIVDDDDYEMLTKIGKWHCNNFGCAVRTEHKEGQKYMLVMHMKIMNADKSVHIDHIDGDRLNNQKSNLRYCTAAQNNWNVKKRANNTSGYKGVYLFLSRF